MFVRAVFGAFRDVMLSILCVRVVKSYLFLISVINLCWLYFFVPARRSKQSWIDCLRLLQLGNSVPSLHAKPWTYSANTSFVYNTYSIQKLLSPKNWRSIQISTLWAGLTNRNDKPIDNSRPHRLWTHEHSRSKQTVPNTWDWYSKYRKNRESI